MIARISILLVILIILPDAYYEWCHWQERKSMSIVRRLVRWIPVLLMLGYTAKLSAERNFAPYDMRWLYVYLTILGLLFVPRAVYTLCLLVATCIKRGHVRQHRWSKRVGMVMALLCAYIFIYGTTIGPRRLSVRQIDLALDGLPDGFDGYRIAHFSDLHVGTIPASLLDRAIDTINAQRPDAIVFTGDLQNLQPRELTPYRNLLSSLHANDGVFSVLGNHDYSFYIKDADVTTRSTYEHETIDFERLCGWTLLRNEHHTIHREADSITIAGEENAGGKILTNRADLRRTLSGVPDSAFVIMLQHTPKSWKHDILPHSHVQLTLSGHTHGGQISIFGLRGTMLTGSHDYGLYEKHGRYLYVTDGLGGLVPFRFGMTPEIAIITLHKKS